MTDGAGTLEAMFAGTLGHITSVGQTAAAQLLGVMRSADRLLADADVTRRVADAAVGQLTQQLVDARALVLELLAGVTVQRYEDIRTAVAGWTVIDDADVVETYPRNGIDWKGCKS